MNVLKKIKSFILTVLGVVFFAFALAMTILLLNYNKYGVTQFGETSIVLIKNKITSDHFQKGDLVIVEAQTLDTINVGDEVFAYKVNKDESVTIDVGVVGNIYKDSNAIVFENGSSYDMEYVAGTAVKKYEKWGGILAFITSKWGFLFLILVPGFLIFIYELYALIVEIKYGSDVY